ncbi:MAG: hypothetical protein Q4G54_12290 [Pelistega sp.]|nr:hypothetical protein [Pelistega sp.]
MKIYNFLMVISLVFLLQACDYVTVEHKTIDGISEEDANKNLNNPAPYGLKIGTASVMELNMRYPKYLYSNNGTMTYRGKNVFMEESITIQNADGSILIFQFDNGYLQNMSEMNIPKKFSVLKNDFDKLYESYIGLSYEEYASIFKEEIKFENYKQYLKDNEDNIAFYKQGEVVIIVAATPNNKESAWVLYRNSNYIPTLKAKYEKLYGPLPAHE